MVKTTIKEITEKFDKNGTLIERLTREEFVEDDENCGVVGTTLPITTTPYTPTTPINPWYGEPYCNSWPSSKISSIDESISNVSELDVTCVTKTEQCCNDRIFADAERTCTTEATAKQYADNSTEIAFKQAVSKCINTK